MKMLDRATEEFKKESWFEVCTDALIAGFILGAIFQFCRALGII